MTVIKLINELLSNFDEITLDTQIYIRNLNSVSGYKWFRGAESVNKYWGNKIVDDWYYTVRGNLRIELEENN